MQRTSSRWSVLMAWALGLLPGTAAAFPDAPAELCRVYPDAPSCRGALPACTTCHTIAPPARNAYGAQVEMKLAPGRPRPLAPEDFVLALPEALHAVEALDADEDGFANSEELMAGSEPANADSTPGYSDCTPAQAAQAAENGWDVCGFDADYVFKKVWIDFCGRSPSWTELEDFTALPAESQRPALHSLLDTCLTTAHWSGPNGVVWNLANDKITPLATLKSGDTFLGEAGDIPLADYTLDYLLFVYAHTGDRDVRELLRATYFVEKDESGAWVKLPELSLIQEYQERGVQLGQFVAPDKRAGMITSRWFLMSNTMFTSIPRTTAAQAYRAYLGFDIARMEGLFSVPNEPVDHDAKGVQRAACAACHATLDPLTYPFSRYEGIGGGDGDGPVGLGNGAYPFTYSPARLARFTTIDGENVTNTPEAGMLMGQPVANVVEWGRVASDSDAFVQNIVREYWTLLLGESPRPRDLAEFTTLWQDLRGEHAYRVERMLHDLIDTEAYGVP